MVNKHQRTSRRLYGATTQHVSDIYSCWEIHGRSCLCGVGRGLDFGTIQLPLYVKIKELKLVFAGFL